MSKQSDGLLKATEFQIEQWIDAKGNLTAPIKLSDFNEKFKVLYCFQSWCPGCHSRGFPNLKKMVSSVQENKNVVFLAIQTVFEGFEENTFEKIIETQKKYNLEIPFGHDAGIDGKSGSILMQNYKTRGTPWFIFINQHNHIVFADFHLNVDAAIEFLKEV